MPVAPPPAAATQWSDRVRAAQSEDDEDEDDDGNIHTIKEHRRGFF